MNYFKECRISIDKTWQIRKQQQNKLRHLHNLNQTPDFKQ